ncbi:hypothetical protein TNCT_579371 [Trichonephila clavata]|uniref:Uncharacterized protein n=1 Tax=Trichonephila clavata TaxID=2740835 RepID=A0A8X6IYI2_TRICU|nr:hypothetical protein TNCT_579371 [Trichonephila clavata]
MYFSRLFLEKIVDHEIIGCDDLIFLMERFKDLGEHDLENVYYYWMENVHKKWLPLLDGPALSMRQPDDIETREPDDPYTKHTIRCRAVNFHNWVVSTPMSRLLFTHLLNEVTVHDFEDYIHLHETKLHVCGAGENHTDFGCLGKPDLDDGTGTAVQPEIVGRFDPVSEQPLEDQTSAHLRLRVIKSLNPDLYYSFKTELLDIFRESLGVLLNTSFGPSSDISQTYLSWETVRSVGNYLSGLKEMGLLSRTTIWICRRRDAYPHRTRLRLFKSILQMQMAKPSRNPKYN